MTDFKETEMRKKCRHCRMRLPEPTSNERQAFCTRGCYNSFYLHRCRVCEDALPKVTGKGRPRVICKKAKCKNAWAAGEGFGKYADSTVSHPVSKNPEKCAGNATNTGIPEPVKAGPRWRIVAGPALTASQFHCATVPDGPDCQWEGGSYERTEAQNRRALERYLAEIEAEACRRDAAAALNHCSACGREDDLTDRANPTLCYPCYYERKAFTRVNISLPADLSIPAFLDRRPLPRPELAMAA
jgi:hypothetical protein